VKALSIRQPWAHAILHLGKDVENRTWPPHWAGLLLVHASKTVDVDAVQYLIECGYDLPDPLVTGALVGTVRLIECGPSESWWAEASQWHWQLTDPHPFLAPIPWRGTLRLFDVPDEVVAR
jgi:hypothetical protein